MEQQHLTLKHLEHLSEKKGITLVSPQDYGKYTKVVGDSAPALTPSTGVPLWALMGQSPVVIKALSQKNSIDLLATRQKVGEWSDKKVQFNIIEQSGAISVYSDFAAEVNSSVNYNQVFRDVFTFQDIVQVGEMETEEMGRVRNLDYVGEKKATLITVANQTMNRIGIKGITTVMPDSTQDIYGIQNDPKLPTPIGLAKPLAELTPEQIVSLFLQLQAQIDKDAGNNLGTDTKYIVITSPSANTAFSKTNSFGLSASKMLQEDKLFAGKLEVLVDNNYANVDSSGDWLQFIAISVGGQPTIINGYTDLYRAHPVIQGLSHWSQKISAGTAGSVVQFPFAVRTLTGVADSSSSSIINFLEAA